MKVLQVPTQSDFNFKFYQIQLDHITDRPHQKLFIEDVTRRIHFARNAPADPNTRRHFLYAAPTGSGKSICELRLLAQEPDFFLITPRIEIIVGMLDKMGVDASKWSNEKIADVALSFRISTPIRFRNMLAKCTLPMRPLGIILDESHHSEADTYAQLEAYLPGCIWVGLTATPYRGTPRSTTKFMEYWGDDVTWLIRVPKAVETGIITLPEFHIWPLCDDDSLEIVNGEFQVTSASAEAISRSADLVKRIVDAGFYKVEPGTYDNHLSGFYDKPTMLCVSSIEHGLCMVEKLREAGLPADFVTADTPRNERQTIFEKCIECSTMLVQIDVVGEGVDLPIRRIIDDAATMSPVRFKQRAGRGERPRKKCSCAGDQIYGWPKEYCPDCNDTGYIDPPSEYIVCNRNLERFCYLYEGLVPPKFVLTLQTAFGGPSQRSTITRAFGLEGLGRFEPAEVTFHDGIKGTLYCIYSIERNETGIKKQEYAVLVHPSYDPVYARKMSRYDTEGNPTWGKWERISGIPDIKGFGSTPPKAVSINQLRRYKQLAKYCGLDVNVEPNRKNIQALFMIYDTRAPEFIYSSHR